MTQEKIDKIEKKILNYEQDEPNSDEEVNSRYLGLQYWCKYLLSYIKELEEGIKKHKRTIYGNDTKEIVALRLKPEQLEELEIDWELYKLVGKEFT